MKPTKSVRKSTARVELTKKVLSLGLAVITAMSSPVDSSIAVQSYVS